LQALFNPYHNSNADALLKEDPKSVYGGGAGRYEYGLRMFRSVLAVARCLIRDDARATEEQTLVQAFKMIHGPRLKQEDVKQFDELVADFFPGSDRIPHPPPNEFHVAIESSMRAQGLSVLSGLVEKVSQLHQILEHRHAVAILGRIFFCGLG